MSRNSVKSDCPAGLANDGFSIQGFSRVGKRLVLDGSYPIRGAQLRMSVPANDSFCSGYFSTNGR